MRRRCRVTAVVLVTGAFALPASAGAATIGPVYPLPVVHGGNQCQPLVTGVDGADGKGSGQTWIEGGGGDNPTADHSCTGTTLPPPFDTSKFASLYWGNNSVPQLALDGAVNSAGEFMSFNTDQSSLANGHMVWTGTTSMRGCQGPCDPNLVAPISVDTRLEVQISALNNAPVALLLPAAAGITNPDVTAVVPVSDSLTNFKVHFIFLAKPTSGGALQPAYDFYNSYTHPPGPSAAITSYGNGFFYTSRPPLADFGCTPAAPVVGDTITCTATDSDPDGLPADPLQELWDWNGDDVLGGPLDKSGHAVSGTFDVGDHKVSLRVGDVDGAQTTVTHIVTVLPVPGTTGTGDGTGGTSDSGAGGGPGGSDATADTLAPLASLKIGQQKLGAILKNGFKGSLTSNEPGTATLTLTIPANVAKKLKLKTAVGTLRLTISVAGTQTFTLKIAKGVAKKLAKLKNVSFVVSGRVADGAGNTKTVSQSLKAKR